MLKKMSNDTVDFVSALLTAAIPFSAVWSTFAYLHYKRGWDFEITTDPKNPMSYVINVVTVITCIYGAIWVGFFLTFIYDHVRNTLLAARQRANAYGATPSRPNLALWGIFLAVAALLYIEGKGKLW